MLPARKLQAFLTATGLAAGMALFIFLAVEISHGKTQEFDRAVLLAMRRPDNLAPLGAGALLRAARDFSALGSSAVLILLVGIIAGFLALDSKKPLAVFICGCLATGLLLETLLKNVFARPRPDIVPAATHAAGASFPSGHSMLSAIVYLSLGASLAGFYPRKVVKVYALTLAVLLTILIGITRVYLGVHWPSDVLAGWAAGGVWVLLCRLAGSRLK